MKIVIDVLRSLLYMDPKHSIRAQVVLRDTLRFSKLIPALVFRCKNLKIYPVQLFVF